MSTDRFLYHHVGMRGHTWRSPIRRALEIHAVALDLVDENLGADALHRHLSAPEREGAALWLSEGVGPGAPDSLGPPLSEKLGIPYVLLEPTAQGRVPASEFSAAAAVITSDRSRLTTLGANPQLSTKLHGLRPLVDLSEMQSALHFRDPHRASLSTRLRLPPDVPWLVAQGPADSDDAIANYTLIGRAMSRLPMENWRLLVAVDGPRRDEVSRAFQGIPQDRIRLWPAPTPSELLQLCVCADLFLWPALGDAGVEGMLEAQAAGVPVVSSRTPGAQERVIDGATGRLVEPGNAEAFSQAVAFLLRHPHFRGTFANDARAAAGEHHLGRAGTDLSEILGRLVSR